MPILNMNEETRRRVGLFAIALAAAVGITLLLIGGGKTGSEESPSSPDQADAAEQSLDAYRRTLEASIASICDAVAGVSDVSVAVSLAGGYEAVYATEQSAAGEVYVVLGSGSSASALLLTHATPQISGIGIVCTGGNDPTVQQRLTALLSAAFALPTNRIYVTGK